MLTLAGVSYRYPGARTDVLHAIDLQLVEGTVTGLAGPSEAGKTTLCLVAGGLAPRVVGGTLVGEMRLDGQDVRHWPMGRLVESVVSGLQDPAAQLSLVAESVLAEVAFGPVNLGLPADEVLERAGQAMALLGIEGLRERDPAGLSGGEQQLVAVAGLLAMGTRHLVLDEPVAHLDAAAAARVLAAVRAVAEAGTAVLLAETRSDALAAACDTVAVVAAGNIVARGAPREILADPTIGALGVAPPASVRLGRLLAEAGYDPALAELQPGTAEAAP